MNNRPSSRASTWSLWAFLVVVVCLVYQEFCADRYDENDKFHRWLKENKWSFHLIKLLQENGISSIEQLLSMEEEAFLHRNQLNRKQHMLFTQKLSELRTANKQLLKWLQHHSLEMYIKGFYKLGYTDIKIIKERLQTTEMKDVITNMDGPLVDYMLLIQAVDDLQESSYGWIFTQTLIMLFHCCMFIFKWIFCLFLLFFAFALIKHSTLQQYRNIRVLQSHLQLTFFHSLIGNYLDPSACKVKWLWKDKISVGTTVTLILKLLKKNPYLSYQITGKENMLIEVRNSETTEEITKEKVGKNTFHITFHPKISGRYSISILLNGRHVAGSPFIRTFMPGPVDPCNITVLNGINMVVPTQGVYYPLKVETRDKYSNPCKLKNEDLFSVDVKKVDSDGNTVDPELVIFPDDKQERNNLHIKIEEEGCFLATVTYRGRSITNGSFHIVSLNVSDREVLNKTMAKNNWNQLWYEGFLLPPECSNRMDDTLLDPDSLMKRSHKVYFYFSSRQVTVKEFYLKVIPYRLYSFRISPSTKVTFPGHDDSLFNQPAFFFDDGIQAPVAFMSSKRSLILATFARLLLRNIGGAESFQDKKRFFYNALQSHHGKVKLVLDDKKVELKVNRTNVLESSYEATKSFSVSKWCRRFFVKFEQEEGYDAGGVSREWISLLCSALFDPKNEMFTQFNKDDRQALIYPNPHRRAGLKLKYYEFAGRLVGKCIFESSCSEIRRLNVRARFMRSFLAQLIGLRVNHNERALGTICWTSLYVETLKSFEVAKWKTNFSYFKTDDKQLYSSKIKYVQKIDPEDLNLTFSDEEYDNDGQFIKEVDLIPNGKNIPVTQQNKSQYLDALAQYRLHTRVSAEVEAFTKGLNDIVPDNLLTMFNEQELELLICGTSDISINDLKQHHRLFAENASFLKVMGWFWKTVALFNQEEIARLLQFTTGSSQLPPGGFAHLKPALSFTSSPLRNVLPRAHTCFNQLVLPDYSSCEEFQRCLYLGITEGCEGFGFE